MVARPNDEDGATAGPRNAKIYRNILTEIHEANVAYFIGHGYHGIEGVPLGRVLCLRLVDWPAQGLTSEAARLKGPRLVLKRVIYAIYTRCCPQVLTCVLAEQVEGMI